MKPALNFPARTSPVCLIRNGAQLKLTDVRKYLGPYLRWSTSYETYGIFAFSATGGIDGPVVSSVSAPTPLLTNACAAFCAFGIESQSFVQTTRVVAFGLIFWAPSSHALIAAIWVVSGKPP